jgi:hypothetical protein
VDWIYLAQDDNWRVLWTRLWTFEVRKMWEISCLARELLASRNEWVLWHINVHFWSRYDLHFIIYCNYWGATEHGCCVVLVLYMSAKDGSSVNYSLVNQIPAKDLIVCLRWLLLRGSQWGDSSCAARHTDTCIHLYSFPQSRVVRPNCTSVICTVRAGVKLSLRVLVWWFISTA